MQLNSSKQPNPATQRSCQGYQRKVSAIEKSTMHSCYQLMRHTSFGFANKMLNGNYVPWEYH
ncbi:uncharacterized protein ASPGLDRAFT_1412754 [Aspergillus glaucus CBS 516.65]|uniref:Uncharacterized protein n=1 Tax=Aspergillus glaucus CBS 516.65 TaxID=1160497 RepID=A0A1L9VMD8_ASPGL|nr:hypothetical protein ASPGLDRAFT_1412754 [Aspergillus glaucus CBS 516.65]OJJ85044.1 hypothetical protein ASPGLDRAFT_1412754 [Aspergillus glaucus CBS 516.65]